MGSTVDELTGSGPASDVLDSEDCDGEFGAGIMVGLVLAVALFLAGYGWVHVLEWAVHLEPSCWFQVPAGESCQTS